MDTQIDILVVKPDTGPYIERIENNNPAIQKLVGGYYEAVFPFNDSVVLLCNENGKLENLERNRFVPELADAIRGTFLVVGVQGSEFASLSPRLAKKYSKRFSLI